ncbi:hypothetical protein [Amycolatopsis sp. NPDC004625]|uniref:hypothetical protein n=1 Tax=Amycolatopsis sp. NPDC004625 TaxID=3154670 RepID=UPI0033A9C362
MSMISVGRVLPEWVSGRAGLPPVTIATVGALLLVWSRSASAGWVMTSVVVVAGIVVVLQRARRRVETILREELDG